MNWIAVIDDDMSNLKLAGTILSRNSMRVTALKSGQTALDYFRKNGFPDLILLDLSMPEMEGFETFHRLKAEMKPGRQIPVAFLTASDDAEKEIRAREEGAADFIRKPFIPDELVRRVRDIVNARPEQAAPESQGEGEPDSLKRSGEDGQQQMSLEDITAILEETVDAPCAMWMGREVFGNIYRFMLRYMDRYHASAFRVLLTLYPAKDITEKEYKEIIPAFRAAIRKVLRDSDVMMECGDRQLFLLLPEVRAYDIQRVTDRLISSWKRTGYAARAEIRGEYAPVITPKQAAGEQRHDTEHHVVIVDDDRTNLLLAKQILGRGGIQVTALTSGEALLDELRKRKPDLILLDMMMPGMDGTETFQLMKNEFAEDTPPVVFLTANENEEAEARCLELGAMDFIRKPFLPDVLLLRIRHTLELIHLQRNLSDAVERKTREKENLSLQVVQTLAEAIDAKDRYTNGHSSRVAEYAREISRRHGYTVRQQDDIYMTGLLHDVGKIGIPDSVINKPGKLTEEEYGVIKTHPVMGARILAKISEMPRLSVGARWHHERYDGTGYPDGLAGDHIPEEARMIAVADAYDAMTSRRSYRDILPQERVRGEIVKGRGTQFDPHFADIMLRMMDEDPEYRMREK